MNEQIKAVMEFVEQRRPQKLFEVEFTQRATWYVLAASHQEAKAAAEALNSSDVDFDYMDVDVCSYDLYQRTNGKKWPEEGFTGREPDSGAFEGEVLNVLDYVVRLANHLIEQHVADEVECPDCGVPSELSDFRCTPDSQLPLFRCPACQRLVDWRELVEQNSAGVDEQTLPMFPEGG